MLLLHFPILQSGFNPLLIHKNQYVQLSSDFNAANSSSQLLVFILLRIVAIFDKYFLFLFPYIFLTWTQKAVPWFLPISCSLSPSKPITLEGLKASDFSLICLYSSCCVFPMYYFYNDDSYAICLHASKRQHHFSHTLYPEVFHLAPVKKIKPHHYKNGWCWECDAFCLFHHIYMKTNIET